MGTISSITKVAEVTNPNWLAPELISHSRATKESDVFGFAIVMWEILTSQFPYSDSSFNFTWQLADAIVSGLRPTIKKGTEAPKGYLALLERCWSSDPSSRPSFSEILQLLISMTYSLKFPAYISKKRIFLDDMMVCKRSDFDNRLYYTAGVIHEDVCIMSTSKNDLYFFHQSNATIEVKASLEKFGIFQHPQLGFSLSQLLVTQKELWLSSGKFY